MTNRGIIYFLKPVNLDGPIKIGFSKGAPGVRIGTISSQSPLILHLIGTIPASFEDEQFLHRCFADLYSHGEWFHSSAHLRAAIENILREGMEFARNNLKETGNSRLWSRRPRSAATVARQSETMRRRWAERKQRELRAGGANA